MYFPSKKDIWFRIIIWGTIFVCIFIPFLDTKTFFSLGRLFLILITIPLVWMWFRTGYMIKDNHLIVVFGPFRKTILIDDIKKINKSKNPLSAPALSIDRLEIIYRKYDTLWISPKNELEFIHLLLSINSQIHVEEKILPNE